MQANSNSKSDDLVGLFLTNLTPPLSPREIHDALQLLKAGFPLRIALRLIQLDRSDPLFDGGDS